MVNYHTALAFKAKGEHKTIHFDAREKLYAESWFKFKNETAVGQLESASAL